MNFDCPLSTRNSRLLTQNFCRKEYRSIIHVSPLLLPIVFAQCNELLLIPLIDKRLLSQSKVMITTGDFDKRDFVFGM